MKSLPMITALAAMFLASAAAADAPRLCVLDTLIDAKPLNGTLATRTAVVGPTSACGSLGARKDTIGSFEWLVLDVDYTRATAGDLTITITTGITAATATADIGFCSTVVGGNCQLDGGGVATITVGASSIHRSLKINIRALRVLKIVAAHSAAAAGDILTLDGYCTD